jgi:NAD(P)-dependent dehydrogenase (short-subunit alcohol dehydrogenase family)
MAKKQQQPFRLDGRRALVVGADSGIGLASARALAAAGAKVAMAGIAPAEGAALAKQIEAETDTAVAYFAADVRDEAAVAAMVDKAVSWLGGLDIAMNNAGIPGPAGPIEAMEAADFDNLFAVNVRGAWLALKYEIRHLKKAGGGSVINLASTAAITGLAFVAAYSATKHAVAGLTRSAALELAPYNIRVNAIAPGPVDTPLLASMRESRDKVPNAPRGVVPMARVASAAEMGGAVVWLASDASSYVTGAIIPIDGGVTAA